MIWRPPRSTLFPTRRSSDLIVGGVRDGAYLREVLPGGASVGAELRAGACTALFSVPADVLAGRHTTLEDLDRKSTRLNSSHPSISYAVFCLKKKNNKSSAHV